MLAQSPPDLLLPTHLPSARETSPSTSLDKLCLVTPSTTGPLSGSIPCRELKAHTSCVDATTTCGSASLLMAERSRTAPTRSPVPNTVHPGPPSHPGEPVSTTGSVDTFTERKELRRPKSSIGLTGGVVRFHPFLTVRPRSASSSCPDGQGGISNARPSVEHPASCPDSHLVMDTSLTAVPHTYGYDDSTRVLKHTHTFSSNSFGSLDCPSTSGTGGTSEEESIGSPEDEMPIPGLPLTIIGTDRRVNVLASDKMSGWGETFPRASGRSLSGSSSDSRGSDASAEHRMQASTGRSRNARGLRIDVRRTSSVGQHTEAKRQEDQVESIQEGWSKVTKYATVGRRPTLSISLDPLSPVKQARQPLASRSLFPLPRSNHLDPEGHARLPYVDGPVQVVSGVWIGNEESVMQFGKWVGGKARGMVVNVAKELDDPFDTRSRDEHGKKTAPGIKVYEATADRPGLTYLKLDWTHGETDLASRSNASESEEKYGHWGFERTTTSMEEARTAGIPILIHCQCGISRSATLTIAYVMWMSYHGLVDETGLGKGATMWDVNDFVKGKSEWVGPNVSLICQLLEWEKVLRHSTRETNEKLAMASRADEHPDPSFAKREAEELDEQMKARRSKRRKSEPDCAVVEQG